MKRKIIKFWILTSEVSIHHGNRKQRAVLQEVPRHGVALKQGGTVKLCVALYSAVCHSTCELTAEGVSAVSAASVSSVDCAHHIITSKLPWWSTYHLGSTTLLCI